MQLRELGKSRLVDPRDPGIFSFRMMRRNWSVFPLVGIISVAVTGAVGFLSYSALTKSDVNFKQSKGMVPRHDRLDPNTYRFKLYTINQKHMPCAEREALLKEIGSYKY